MHWLEHRIPPPVVALVCAALMFWISRHDTLIDLGTIWRVLLTPLIFAWGTVIAIAGNEQFKKHNTTINPLHPERMRTYVRTGIYNYTRHPMYLGIAICLGGWAVALSSPLAGLVGITVFVLYMNRFQIGPEERILAERYPEEYAEHISKVRRWW